eukprot:342895-Pelagomonas_calceolata.AAC.2
MALRSFSHQMKRVEAACGNVGVVMSNSAAVGANQNSQPATWGTRLENYVGRGNSPYINQGKGNKSAQKSCESPLPPPSYKTESVVKDMEGYWMHLAPGPGFEKHHCFH